MGAIFQQLRDYCTILRLLKEDKMDHFSVLSSIFKITEIEQWSFKEIGLKMCHIF